MSLRDLIFSVADNRGVDYDRAAGDGEYMRRWEHTECGWFAATPRRYEWTGTALVEFSGWAAEQAALKLAADQAAMEAAIVAEENKWSWSSIEHPSFSGVFHKVTDALARTTKRFRDIDDESPFPLNGGAWRDVNGSPVQMTMGELRELEDAIFDRAAHNDGVAEYHKTEMRKLSDPTTYDYSGGWQ